MHSDQRQPGSRVIRAALMPPRSTTSMRVLLGVRTSSADPKPFLTIPAIVISPSTSFPAPLRIMPELALIGECPSADIARPNRLPSNDYSGITLDRDGRRAA